MAILALRSVRGCASSNRIATSSNCRIAAFAGIGKAMSSSTGPPRLVDVTLALPSEMDGLPAAIVFTSVSSSETVPKYRSALRMAVPIRLQQFRSISLTKF